MAQRRTFTGRFRDDDNQRSDESYRSSAYDDRARWDRTRDDRDFHADNESRRPWQSPNFSDGQARNPGYGPSHVAQPSSPQPAYPSTFIENHTGLGYGQGQSMFGGGAVNSGLAQDSTQVPFYAHPHPPQGINPTAGWPMQYSTSPSPYAGSGFAQQAQGATHYGSAPYGGQTSGTAPARYQGQSQQQAGSYGTQESQFGQHTSGVHSHAHDYGRWRHEQLNKLDTQYQTWRDHQARQYDDEFARFSQHRHAEFSKRLERNTGLAEHRFRLHQRDRHGSQHERQ